MHTVPTVLREGKLFMAVSQGLIYMLIIFRHRSGIEMKACMDKGKIVKSQDILNPYVVSFSILNPLTSNNREIYAYCIAICTYVNHPKDGF